MDNFFIHKEFSADNRIIGPCWNCKCYSNIMWTTNNFEHLPSRNYRCRKCAFGTDVRRVSPYFPGTPFTSYKDLSSHDPGNIFKCPQKKCSRTDLSFKEFYFESCCESKTDSSEVRKYDDAEKIDHDYIENIVQVHKKYGVLQIQAQAKYDKADKIFEEAEESLRQAQAYHDKAKKTFEEAEEQLKNNEAKLKNIEDLMAIYFARTATSIKEGKSIEEDPRLFCKICCEEYNDTDRVRCVLLCRHSSCEKCLTSFPNKKCPVCRKPFTDNQIIKLVD